MVTMDRHPAGMGPFSRWLCVWQGPSAALEPPHGAALLEAGGTSLEEAPWLSLACQRDQFGGCPHLWEDLKSLHRPE